MTDRIHERACEVVADIHGDVRDPAHVAAVEQAIRDYADALTTEELDEFRGDYLMAWGKRFGKNWSEFSWSERVRVVLFADQDQFRLPAVVDMAINLGMDRDESMSRAGMGAKQA